MKKNKQEVTKLNEIENFLDYNQLLKVNDKTFKNLMFIYSIAIRELESQINILKDEIKMLYNYELIEQVNDRIKTPKSIIDKMQDKGLELTYKDMIENINDIAGIRVICSLKEDIFVIKDLIENFPGIKVLKEKDYVTNPKKCGYSSYHIIAEVPVMLYQDVVYVKAEIQIRTAAMDFWANWSHKMIYKPENSKNTLHRKIA